MCFLRQMIITSERARRRAARAVAAMFLLLIFSGLALSGQVEFEDQLLRAAAQSIEKRQFATAAELLRKVLAGDPNSARAYNLVGICQARTGEYEGARKCFEKAIELNPRFAATRVNLGNLLIGMHEDAAALKEFLAAIAIEPNDPRALKNIGLIYGRQERFDLAAKYLKRAREVAPGDREITLVLAEAQISGGKKQEAKGIIAELAKAGQLDSKSRETLALLWLENGDPQDAVDLVRGDPGLSAPFYKLGHQKAEAQFEAGTYAERQKILETIRNIQTPHAGCRTGVAQGPCHRPSIRRCICRLGRSAGADRPRSRCPGCLPQGHRSPSRSVFALLLLREAGFEKGARKYRGCHREAAESRESQPELSGGALRTGKGTGASRDRKS